MDDNLIRTVLGSTRRIAVVGASARPERPGNGVFAFLVARGFEVVGVNPGLAGRTLHGRPVVATPGRGRAAGHGGRVPRVRAGGARGDEAIRLRARTVWLQLGVVNEAAAAAARAAGLLVVMDRCPAIEWRRLGLGRQVGPGAT